MTAMSIVTLALVLGAPVSVQALLLYSACVLGLPPPPTVVLARTPSRRYGLPVTETLPSSHRLPRDW